MILRDMFQSSMICYKDKLYIFITMILLSQSIYHEVSDVKNRKSGFFLISILYFLMTSYTA